MFWLKLKSKLIEAKIFKEYEENHFWFSRPLCIIFWSSALVIGPILSLFSMLICKTTGFFKTFFIAIYLLLFIWQLFSFIIFLVNFIKWKNILGPWEF